MFARLGTLTTRHPWAVIVAWILLLASLGGAALFGFGQGGLFARMSTSDFVVAGADSEHVSSQIGNTSEAPTAIIVVSGVDMTDDAAAVAAFATEHRSLLEVDGVDSVVDPFAPSESMPPEALLSTDGTGFSIFVAREHLEGVAEKDARAALDDAVASYDNAVGTAFPGARAIEVSEHVMATSILDQIESDLIRGESIGLPIAALLMVIVFGGFIAAAMPLVGALSAIAVGMGVLWVATFATSIDSFILNVVSIIGVALSVDYGLLVVSRFREEGTELLHRGRHKDPSDRRKTVVQAAVKRSVETAGRTVTFSAVTIAVAMAGLMFMRIHVLKTISLGGITVTLLAVLAAITLVPALLTLLGTRILRPSPVLRIPLLGALARKVGDSASDHGAFSTLAHRVHRHPWWVMLGTFALLVILALPLRGLELRNNFMDYIPRETDMRVAYNDLQDHYPALAQPAIQVVADVPAADSAEVMGQISGVEGVESVLPQPLASDTAKTLMNVATVSSDPASKEVSDVVRELRDLDLSVDFWVGGPAALQVDMLDAIIADAPLALLVVVLAVMVLLFLMTGSLLVPIKALIINSLSVLAALGATTFIFQHGIFGVPQTAGLELFIVSCMIAFGFGLAMDYEVFLLARIKEYWDAGDSNDDAVAKGLQRSGRIITSAAAIIIAVFVGFALGEMIAIKEIGVALAIMVALDATITRLLLVPATMTVLGKWNWWAPRPLARLAEKIGFRE